MPAPARLHRYWLAPLIVAGLTDAFWSGSWYGAHRVRTMNEWADAQRWSTVIDSVRAKAMARGARIGFSVWVRCDRCDPCSGCC